MSSWSSSSSSSDDAQWSDSSAAPIDNLASTTFPPPGMDPSKVPAHREYLTKMTESARNFYEADKELSKDDRAVLGKAFRNQLFGQHIGGGLGLVIGIFTPRYLCKYLNKPYKGSYSVWTALVTVISGYSIGQQAVYQSNTSKYSGNKNYITALSSLKGYPPLLGYSYYQETARNEDSRMPDPSTLDWNRFPPFPLVLTVTRAYRLTPDGMTPVFKTSTSTSATSNSSGPYDSLSEPNDNSDSPAPSGTSTWDRIRAQNSGPLRWESQHPEAASHTKIPPPSNDSFDDPFEEKEK